MSFTQYIVHCVTCCVTPCVTHYVIHYVTHCVTHCVTVNGIYIVTQPLFDLFVTMVMQHIKRTDSKAELLLPQELPLCGDVKVEVFHQARFGGKVCVCVFMYIVYLLYIQLRVCVCVCVCV